jgi:hypothetical protein
MPLSGTLLIEMVGKLVAQPMGPIKKNKIYENIILTL